MAHPTAAAAVAAITAHILKLFIPVLPGNEKAQQRAKSGRHGLCITRAIKEAMTNQWGLYTPVCGYSVTDSAGAGDGSPKGDRQAGWAPASSLRWLRSAGEPRRGDRAFGLLSAAFSLIGDPRNRGELPVPAAGARRATGRPGTVAKRWFFYHSEALNL